jgi:hypothetical protein
MKRSQFAKSAHSAPSPAARERVGVRAAALEIKPVSYDTLGALLFLIPGALSTALTLALSRAAGEGTKRGAF